MLLMSSLQTLNTNKILSSSQEGSQLTLSYVSLTQIMYNDIFKLLVKSEDKYQYIPIHLKKYFSTIPLLN